MIDSFKRLRFLAVEKITLIYIAITTLVICFLMPQLKEPFELLGYRALIVITIFILGYLSSLKSWWVIKLARYSFIGALLSFWYPDTFDINRVLINNDHVLANIEQYLFGCQPALLFSDKFPQHWISEILNMGYFAYYPIILGSSLYFFFLNKRYFEKFFFVIICSFYFYYLFYIFFPTAGPQYYFPAIGEGQVHLGVFPEMDRYFDKHSELKETTHRAGFFFQMVENTQSVGERPTAAFPSSHVGISSLIVLLTLGFKRYKMFFVLLPIYFALVMATVYIEAHYLIDVFGGIISAIIFYFVCNALFELFTKRYHGKSEYLAITENNKGE